MAGVLIPISSTTLGSSAASVTFSSIPQTYTDLVVRMSVRTDFAMVAPSVSVTFNGAGTFSRTYIFGNGSTASSGRATGGAAFYAPSDGANATANTFSSAEIYLPNYTGSAQKPILMISSVENNATDSLIWCEAELFNGTYAINTITISNTNIVAGSTFHLYGIK